MTVIDDGNLGDRLRPVAMMNGKDVAESARVGILVRAAAQQCWINCRRAVLTIDGYADASYVEGILCLNDVSPIEHAWVCRPDGTIIDPTLPMVGGAYFGGPVYRGRREIDEFLSTEAGRACKRTPFFYSHGWGGRDSPGMCRAWEMTWAHLRALHPETFIPGA